MNQAMGRDGRELYQTDRDGDSTVCRPIAVMILAACLKLPLLTGFFVSDPICRGAGNDQLVDGGRDGTGNDKLWGDDQTEADLGGQYPGSDYLDGGADDDDSEADLAGLYQGNDYLDGGADSDSIWREAA